MPEPTFALTYLGTLLVAVLMFAGQLAAFAALLAFVGILKLAAAPFRHMSRSRTRQPAPPGRT